MTIQELPTDDVELLSIEWAENDRDLSFRLRLPGTDRRIVRLFCEWADGLHVALDAGAGYIGSALSWDMTFDRGEDGRWSVLMDFASTGSVSFKCSTLTVLDPS